MATIVNMGSLLGEAEETAQVHGLTPEAREWLLRRVYRQSGRRAELHRTYNFERGIADDWLPAFQWDWTSSLPAEELERMLALKEASEQHVATAAERGEVLVWCPPFPELQLVADWLACLPTDDPDMLRKLDRVSWDDAVTLTDQWHARLAKRMSWKASAAELAEGTRAVLGLPDGWRWVRLETKEALDREGEAMGHCVGHGGYDGLLDVAPPEGVYSLRDANGHPHVTLQVHDGKVEQAKGKANTTPKGHAERLAAILQALGVRIVYESPGRFGLAKVGGRNMSVADALTLVAAGPVEGEVDFGESDITTLPPGTDIRGDLWLRKCESLASLPAGLKVGGSIHLEGCPSLETLPVGLKVGGNLDLTRCISLKRLPERLEVGKGLNLTECSALKSLPTGLKVGGFLDLTGCSALESLPECLKVGGCLDLIGCPSLETLPEGLSIGGSLLLEGCTALRSLPRGLQVGEAMFLSGCASLRRLHEGLEVGGSLHVTKCPSLAYLPDGLKVGGSLYVKECPSLRGLPDKLSVKLSVVLNDCVGLEFLPDGLQVAETLDLVGCTSLACLPERLKVERNLYLHSCTSLERLPPDMQVGGEVFGADHLLNLDVSLKP